MKKGISIMGIVLLVMCLVLYTSAGSQSNEAAKFIKLLDEPRDYFWDEDYDWTRTVLVKVTKNPIKSVKFFREDEGRLRFLEQEEIKRLYDTCPGYLKPIVALAVSTGMRKGEILSLKWPDVDFRRKIITILKTKSQRKRENRKIAVF